MNSFSTKFNALLFCECGVGVLYRVVMNITNIALHISCNRDPYFILHYDFFQLVSGAEDYTTFELLE